MNLTRVYGGARTDLPDQAGPVRVVGIFGANASGKSNSLHALSFMRRMATRSDREVEPGLGLSREPFRLDPESLEDPSRYVVDLLLRDVHYTYGFTIDNDRVLEEWMYYYPLNRKRRVFERNGDRFEWGEESGKRSELERIAEITAPSALFLSTVARFGGRNRPSDSTEPEPLHNVYRWFFQTRARSRPGIRLRGSMIVGWPEAKEDRAVIVSLLRAADVGITDVSLKPPVQESLLTDLDDLDVEAQEAARRPRREFPATGRRRLQFSHKGPHGTTLLGLEDESTGTQQLLDLAMDASFVLRQGGTMTVDEIDASLHPMLTAKLIGLFQQEKTNPLGSQLIFTSHDASLLGTFDTEEILSRDEIWFTEKDDDGISVLYPLTDFRPRKEGENRQRRYLNGNYGAVPDLSTDLFEQALLARGELGDEATR